MFHDTLARVEKEKRERAQKATFEAKNEMQECLRDKWPGKKVGARFADCREFCSQFAFWDTLANTEGRGKDDYSKRDEIFQDVMEAFERDAQAFRLAAGGAAVLLAGVAFLATQA